MGTFTQRGEVTCLRVEGQTAYVGGVITEYFQPLSQPLYFLFTIVDNGSPSSGADLRTTLWTYDTDPGCTPGTHQTLVWPIDHGNFTVR